MKNRLKDWPLEKPAPKAKKPKAGPKLSHKFTFQGRRYSLYKRDKSKLGMWYICIQRDNKRKRQSLDTNDPSIAEARAKFMIKKVTSGKWSDWSPPEEPPPKPTTLADVMNLYETLTTIAPRSARNNKACMMQVVQQSLGLEFEADSYLIENLNSTIVSKFQIATVKRYCFEAPKNDEDQRLAKERALRSSRSVISQARSLFTKLLPELYREQGLIIPDSVESFMTCKLEGSTRKPDYNPPAESVVQNAFVQIETIKQKDPHAYIGFWFAIGAGLRQREIQRMKWEYLVDRQDGTWVSGGVGKDGLRIEVPMQVKAVEALSDFRKEQGRVLDEEIGLTWSRRLNGYLFAWGWRTEKKLHELRAYIGSLIYQQNPVAAMRFLRHKSIKQTEEAYVRYRTDAKPVNVL